MACVPPDSVAALRVCTTSPAARHGVGGGVLPYLVFASIVQVFEAEISFAELSVSVSRVKQWRQSVWRAGGSVWTCVCVCVDSVTVCGPGAGHSIRGGVLPHLVLAPVSGVFDAGISFGELSASVIHVEQWRESVWRLRLGAEDSVCVCGVCAGQCVSPGDCPAQGTASEAGFWPALSLRQCLWCVTQR